MVAGTGGRGAPGYGRGARASNARCSEQPAHRVAVAASSPDDGEAPEALVLELLSVKQVKDAQNRFKREMMHAVGLRCRSTNSCGRTQSC